MPQVTPQRALELLMEGNARFAEDSSVQPRADAARRKKVVEHGQQPFATIITCSDSRVPPELIFDQGIGDLFVIRVAGNVCGPSELASIEYAVSYLHTPILVVLGHTDCGAVTAATTGADVQGHMAPLLKRISPAVDKARSQYPDLRGPDLVPYVVELNVWQSIEELFTASAVAVELVRGEELQVFGAVYHLDDGRVEWLDPHPEQDELLG
ncbi:MAG: carbonic anhydrase [Phycisphaerales bacterium]|nr:MAG: carbonic anhydrase [Phycisphaerales bacterium]